MAQTFLITAPAKNAKGKVYRIVKDRAWNDMPFSYLVQTLKTNYEMGKNRTRWVCSAKFATVEEAKADFAKRVGAKPDPITEYYSDRAASGQATLAH
jgi:hypothetical protein